jgi:hypothetical protein
MKRFSGVLFLLSFCALGLVACGESSTATTVTGTTAATTNTATSVVTGTTVVVSSAVSGTTVVTGTTVVAASTVATKTTASTVVTGTTAAVTGASTITTTVATANLDLPIYSGLKPLSLGSLFEQALAQGITGQAGADVKYGIYSTSDSASQVITYYNTEMKAAGFNKVGEQDIPVQEGFNLPGKIAAYQKGSIGAVVTILGPLDTNIIALLTSQSPSAAQQLKVGDSMVLIFNNLNGSVLPTAGVTPNASITAGTTTKTATPTKLSS